MYDEIPHAFIPKLIENWGALYPVPTIWSLLQCHDNHDASGEHDDHYRRDIRQALPRRDCHDRDGHRAVAFKPVLIMHDQGDHVRAGLGIRVGDILHRCI